MSQLPEWIRLSKVDETTIEFGGQTYPVYILDRGLEPALPGFMGFPPPHEFLFISEEVPESWRDYVLRHELREILDLSECEDRCVQSLQTELAEVSEEELADYIGWRLNFFNNLVAYYEAQETTDEAFFARFCASRDYLQEETKE